MVNDLQGVTLSKREQGFRVVHSDPIVRKIGNGSPLEGNRILPRHVVKTRQHCPEALGTLPNYKCGFLGLSLSCPHRHKKLSQKMTILEREAGALGWAGHSWAMCCGP